MRFYTTHLRDVTRSLRLIRVTAFPVEHIQNITLRHRTQLIEHKGNNEHKGKHAADTSRHTHVGDIANMTVMSASITLLIIN